MGKMKKNLFITIIVSVCLIALTSCESVLDPMANGHYTEENMDEFPSIMSGFVEEAYVLTVVNSYLSDKFAYLDCTTDIGVLSNDNSICRKMANSAISPNQDAWAGIWKNDYQGIYYVNRFLKDNEGYNTHYILSHENDMTYRKDLKGDAFAIRAWLEYDLLQKYGARTVDGDILGFVIMDKYVDQSTAAPSDYKRASYDECVEQILRDCDSAKVYLPLANRDWESGLNINIEGGQRWGRFDGISMTALKAMTCLMWASDAFNPNKDQKRWEMAAEYAWEAMQYKIEKDFPHSGTSVTSAFSWLDPNSPECYVAWSSKAKTNTYEANLYPNGFRGSGIFGPSQELVDAFPMANGYPITDARSGYDPQNPYAGRDPRFYANIFYHGANLVKSGKTEVMYTFDMSEDGADAAGNTKCSITNYYLKKFMYTGYNGADQSVQTMPRVFVPIGWRDMCLTFAEAANRAVGPTDTRFGISAREALSYIRNRTTSDGAAGLGTKGDPYLDECARDKDKFEALVRNERKIEFCFEGKYFFDLARWDVPLSERNKPVHRPLIKSVDGKLLYDYSPVADNRNLKSNFLPFPYSETVAARWLVQNEGWESWVLNF